MLSKIANHSKTKVANAVALNPASGKLELASSKTI